MVLESIILLAAIPLAGVAGTWIGNKLADRDKDEPLFTCPYDGLTFTGIQSLDAINHVGCYGRSLEDLKTMKALAPAKTTKVDEYFHTTESHKWYYSSQAPNLAKPFLNLKGNYYYATKLFVYRNGKVIDERWISQNNVDANVTAIIELDKHKRRHKTAS